MAGEDREHLRTRLRDLLVEARLASGITQTELAKALGRLQSFVSNFERGERRIEVADFILIARVLKTNPSELLRRTEEV